MEHIINIFLYSGTYYLLSPMDEIPIWLLPLLIPISYTGWSIIFDLIDRYPEKPPLVLEHVYIAYLNTFLISIASLYLQLIGWIRDDRVSILSHLWIVPLWTSVLDVFFSLTHRTLHLPIFYSRFHKLHHIHKKTRPWYAQFATPVDCIASTVFPLYAITLLIVLPTRICIPAMLPLIRYNTNAHRYRSNPDINRHSIHHEKYNRNYADSEIMEKDRISILGTRKSAREMESNQSAMDAVLGKFDPNDPYTLIPFFTELKVLAEVDPEAQWLFEYLKKVLHKNEPQ